MSRKIVKSSKSSKVKIDKKNLDIYDQFRPHSGIKYYLSQTEVNWSAGVPRLHLTQTAVEYEPGQDLTTPPVEQDESVARYTKRKYRGPVWRFQEEIEAEKREKRAERMKRIVKRRLKAATSKSATAQKDKLHAHIIHSIGPEWYHELSNKQMHSADHLKNALLQDHANKSVANTQGMLTDLGLAVWPHHTKIAHVLRKYYQCPVEFLLKLYQLNRSKLEVTENCYTLDNKLLLSAVVHLTMRNTLRELHLRIPSPAKVKKDKHKEQVKKKIPVHPSPYLNPFPFIPQPDPEGISKSRRKEYPKSRYFNYVKDMYEEYYEVQSESSVRKEREKQHQSKYDKPPKIPVRQLARKLIGQKKCRLKKPSVYVNPCDKIEEEPDNSIEDRIVYDPSKVPEEEEQISTTPRVEEEESVATSIDTQQSKPSAQDNGQRVDKDEEPDDKQEEITDDCTFKPVRENRLEKETKLDDVYQLCTCGQADKEEEDRKCQKERYQRTRQFLFNLNMYNIEYNTFYYPCTCRHGQSESCTVKLNKMADKIDERHKAVKEESEETRNKEQNDDREKTEENPRTQNKEQSNDKQNKEQMDEVKNKEQPEETKDKVDKTLNDGEQIGEKEKSKQKDDKKSQRSLIKDNKEPKKNVNADDNLLEKVNGTNDAVQGDATESKGKADEEENQEEAHDEDLAKRTQEKCRCMKMYDKYMDTHEHCLDLFEDYKMKIDQDISEYMKDIEENRCTCGDSSDVNQENESTKDDHIEEIVEGCICGNVNRKHGRKEDINKEEIVEGCTCRKSKRKHSKQDVNSEEIMEGCTCGNKQRKPAKAQREANDESTFMRCTCGTACNCGPRYDNARSNDFYDCTCGNNEARPTITKGFKLCTCPPKQDHGSKYKTKEDSCVLSTILEEIDDSNNAEEQDTTNMNKQKMPDTLSHSQNVSTKSLRKLQAKEEDSQEESQDGTDVVQEVDPRIIVLSKFPRKHKQQMMLLKKALGALAADGYPLAKLPECHRLPQFQVWLDKRSGKYLSMAKRVKYLEQSRMLWNHTDVCRRKVSLPELGIHPSVARKMTWEGAYKYKRMITDTMYTFNRTLKQAYVSETQEFFPTTFHHKMPNKTFRDCYFAYLPSDEHQINVYRPWQLHEHKDATKSQRCN